MRPFPARNIAAPAVNAYISSSMEDDSSTSATSSAAAPEPGSKRSIAQTQVGRVDRTSSARRPSWLPAAQSGQKSARHSDDFETDSAFTAALIAEMDLTSTSPTQRTAIDHALLGHDMATTKALLEQMSALTFSPDNLLAIWNKALAHPGPEMALATLALSGKQGLETLHEAELATKLQCNTDYRPVLHGALRFDHAGLKSILKRHVYPSKHAMARAPNTSTTFSNGTKIFCEPVSVDWAIQRCLHHRQKVRLQNNPQLGGGKRHHARIPFGREAFSPENIAMRMTSGDMEHIGEYLLATSADIAVFDLRQFDDFSAQQFRQLDTQGPWHDNTLSERISIFGLFMPEHALAIEFKIKSLPSGERSYSMCLHDPNNPFLHSRRRAQISNQSSWHLEPALLGSTRLAQYGLNSVQRPHVMSCLYSLDLLENLSTNQQRTIDTLRGREPWAGGTSGKRRVKLPSGPERFAPDVLAYILTANLVDAWVDLERELRVRAASLDDDATRSLFALQSRQGDAIVLSLAAQGSPILRAYLDTVLALDKASALKLAIVGTPNASGDTAIACADVSATWELLRFLDRIDGVNAQEKFNFVNNVISDPCVPVFAGFDIPSKKVEAILNFVDRQSASEPEKCAAIIASGYAAMIASDLDAGTAEVEVRDKLRALFDMKQVSQANMRLIVVAIDAADIAVLLAEPDASDDEDDIMKDDDSDLQQS